MALTEFVKLTSSAKTCGWVGLGFTLFIPTFPIGIIFLLVFLGIVLGNLFKNQAIKRHDLQETQELSTARECDGDTRRGQVPEPEPNLVDEAQEPPLAETPDGFDPHSRPLQLSGPLPSPVPSPEVSPIPRSKSAPPSSSSDRAKAI